MVNESTTTKCGERQLNRLFDPSASQTFHYLTCQECVKGACHPRADACHLKASYREGSGWKAREAQDVCQVGDSATTTTTTSTSTTTTSTSPFQFLLQFGCQTSLQGAFATQLEDGILGMENKDGTLWRQMHDAGVLQHRGFALCFGHGPRTEQQAGILTLGGWDDRYHDTTMVYTRGLPATMNSVYFGVQLRKIYLNKASQYIRLKNVSAAAMNENPIVVDSGATETYLTKAIKPAFQEAWKQLSGGSTFRSKEGLASIDHLPTLLLQLKGDYDRNKDMPRNHPLLAGSLDPKHYYDVLVAIPPSHLYEYFPDYQKYYPRFHFDAGTDNAFGSSTMLGHDIYFEEERIGWARSSCDYNAFLQKHGIPSQVMNNVTKMKILQTVTKMNDNSRESYAKDANEFAPGSNQSRATTDTAGVVENMKESIVDDDDSEATEGEVPEFRSFNYTTARTFTRIRHPPASLASPLATTASKKTTLSRTVSLYGVTLIVVAILVARWIRERPRRRGKHSSKRPSASPYPPRRPAPGGDQDVVPERPPGYSKSPMRSRDSNDRDIGGDDKGERGDDDDDDEEEEEAKWRLSKQNGQDLVRRTKGPLMPTL